MFPIFANNFFPLTFLCGSLYTRAISFLFPNLCRLLWSQNQVNVFRGFCGSHLSTYVHIYDEDIVSLQRWQSLWYFLLLMTLETCCMLQRETEQFTFCFGKYFHPKIVGTNCFSVLQSEYVYVKPQNLSALKS